MRWVLLVLGCLAGSRLALPVTVFAAERVLDLGLTGTTAAVTVQLVRDLSVLAAVLFVALWFAPACAMPALAFCALGALLLAVAEPVFAARRDIVAAAWTLPRIIGRLSALLFALTGASYLDVLSDRPRGALRTASRQIASAITFGAAFLLLWPGLRTRGAWRILAQLLGIQVGASEEELPAAFSVAPKTLYERIAALAAWPKAADWPRDWRRPTLEAGPEPRSALHIDGGGMWLPGRYRLDA